MTTEADETNGHRRRRKLTLLVTVWAVLAAAMILLARQNLSVPGLYYDEAVFAGMAKDFIAGNVHGEHMPDHQVVRLAGRPFPLFMQTYLGTLKSWMLIPGFRIFGPTVAVLRATPLFWSLMALACIAFARGAGPMLLKIPRMFALTNSGPHPNAPGEMTTKLKTMLSMYDGSHFYRLMNVGGVFERMYEGSSGPKAAIGIAFILICVAFCGLAYRRRIVKPRAIAFLIVAMLLVTIGVFLLPDAVRIHHGFLVYPFPQLIIAALFSLLWGRKILVRVVAVLAIAIVCGRGLRTIAWTQQVLGAPVCPAAGTHT